MLDKDPSIILQEIKASEELRKRHLVNTNRLIRRMVGNHYRSDMKTSPVPENMIYSYVATLLPQIVFDNPAVTVSAKRAVSHRPIAEYMAMALNGWIKEVRLRDELELIAIDMLFGFGCAKVGIEPRGDYAGIEAGVEGRFTMQALTPFAVRISPTCAVIDSQATSWADARMIGHRFQRDLSDLQADERYDPEALKSLSADEEPIAVSRQEDSRPRNRTDLHRGRVTLYELYFPETRQIGTLALYAPGRGDKAAWVRPLTDYKGPDTGPYEFFGVYTVPDQVYPLSPIAAMADQEKELNAHATAAAEEAATAKKLILVDANQPDLAAEIEKAKNGDIVKVKGLNAQNVANVDIGGISEARLAYLDRLLVRTDRVSGSSEATRGRATGVTATEAQLADSNAESRTEYLNLKFREGAKRVLGKIGWYFYFDPAVVVPVSFEDPQSGQQSEGLFLGGVQPGQEGTDWMDFFLDIEPYSMRRVDPNLQAQRAQMMQQLVLSLAPMIPQMPFINWQSLLDMIGEANNLPDLAKILLNPMGLQMIQGLTAPGTMGGGAMNPMGMAGMPPGASPGVQMAMQGGPVGMMPPGQLRGQGQQQRLPMGGPAPSPLQGGGPMPAGRPMMAGS